MLRLAALAYLLLVFLCIQRTTARDRSCVYESDRGQLDKCYRSKSYSRHFYGAFPCRYKMASFQCGSAQAEATVDHGLSKHFVFRGGYPHTSGGLYIRLITLNITTKNSDGSLTSQVLQLDTDKFAEYRKMANSTIVPWEWTYSGSQPPRRKDRIEVTLDKKYVFLNFKNVTVFYKHSGHRFKMICHDDVFLPIGDPYTTVCGFSGQNDRALMAELASKTKTNTTKNDYRLREVVDNYIDLAKQTAVQTDPLCLEARNLLTGDCSDLGITLNKCAGLYSTHLERDMGRCLRKNGIDSFKVYLTCVRALCKLEMEDTKKTCGLLQKVVDACADASTGDLSLKKFIFRAGCSDTVVTNTTRS